MIIIATKKLYYENGYLSAFEATVVQCLEYKDGFAVILDKTAFYPVGGGQPCDTGKIDTADVVSVFEKDSVVTHVTTSPVTTGALVNCTVDWQKRFPLMQEHTGEHIISGIIKKKHGLNNVGFHMGSEFVSIDIDGVMSKEHISAIEYDANCAVYKNIPVTAEFVPPGNLDGLDFRSKRDFAEDVRIVTIQGYDTCACCGVHVNYTGEIGVVKIVNFQKYKKGMRLFVLCGSRAVTDYAEKNARVYEISELLSAKPSQVHMAVKQLMEENGNLKYQLTAFRQRRLTEIAASTPENSGTVCIFEDDLTNDELRKLCSLLCEKSNLAAVFSPQGDLFKYAVGSLSADIRPVVSKLNKAFSGKGGGSAALASGSLIASEDSLRNFFYDTHC